MALRSDSAGGGQKLAVQDLGNKALSLSAVYWTYSPKKKYTVYTFSWVGTDL